MIKKTIIVTIIFLLVHIGYRDILKKDIVISQAEWQNTHITIETFLYNKKYYPNIIVGSSIARRIETDSLPNFFNFAFEGNAAYIGLDLILERNILPKHIFIEINLLNKIEESNIIKNSSLISPLKRYIPALRDGKQPLPLLATYFETHIASNIIPYQFKMFSSKDASNNTLDSIQQNIMRSVLISQEDPNFSKPTLRSQEGLYTSVINRLRPYIEEFNKKGVELVFFQVPSEGTFNFASQIDAKIKKAFEGNNISYIPYPETDSIYKTTDNWHLDKASSSLYTSYLKYNIINN